MASEEETVYCLCRKPYDGLRFMIECGVCSDWFHGSCVGIEERQATDIETYHCPNCAIQHGPLKLKRRRNYHRHDYSETDYNVSKAIQTGTVLFVKELKHRTFPSGDDIPIVRLRGYELTVEYLIENGFDAPILVDSKDGLDLQVPPPSFSIQDVENHVGSMREIDVIDVAKQEDYRMLMREWTEYYNSPNRSKIYNVISLEFSNTKLAELVVPPRIIQEMSLVNNYWPTEIPADEAMFQKPEVQRYCLMGVKDSFTDFHIDFGGTSVWYHILRGEKVFYLIRPTPANLALYENWLSSANQSETFFGDQVDCCYQCTVRTGQTIFLPTGWIHAVLTPIDSLIFGGNFLHTLNMGLQIQVYDIEKRVKTPDKFLFPNFEILHWYTAKHILDTLKDFREDKRKPPDHLISGSKALTAALKSWTHKKDHVKKENIPETIQYGRLLKDLQKELKHYSPKEERKSSRTKKAKESKKEKAVPVNKEDKKSKERDKGEKKKRKKKTIGSTKTLGSLMSPKQEVSPIRSGGKASMAFSHLSSVALPPASSSMQPHDAQNVLLSSLPSPSSDVKLSFKLWPAPQDQSESESKKLDLKPQVTSLGTSLSSLQQPGNPRDLSVYDFDEDDGPKPAKVRRSVSTKSNSMFDPVSEGSPRLDLQPKLKLKVSSGKLIGDSKSAQKRFHWTSASETPESPESNVEASYTMEGDDEDEDHLVVDESPRRRRRQTQSQSGGLSPSALKPGSLKLKLSCNKFNDTSVPESNLPASSLLSSNHPYNFSRSPIRSPGRSPGTRPEGRTDILAMNRSGVNGSISDILEASGFGKEAESKLDQQRRDAIQGMLSMSTMGTLNSRSSQSSSHTRPQTSMKLQAQKSRQAPGPDLPEKMPMCFKDKEYVYPTLDVSDNEDEHVFRPRGRQRKDETWNPKARLIPHGPKPERPQREGTRKESVESGLAAAAAKLATMPRPKRQYIRRKPKPEKSAPQDMLASLDAQPSTSAGLGLSSSAPASVLGHGLAKRPGNPPKAAPKKMKKGMATAKQRLGKILKIHKIIH